jgi:hypothetical protein
LEQQFFTKYPDLVGQQDFTRQVARALLNTYPEQCSRLTPEVFIDYLQSETVKLLNAQAKQLGFENWQAAQAVAQAKQPTPAQPTTPQAAPLPPTAARAPHAPGPTGPTSVPRPRMPSNPPAAHAPGATPTATVAPGWGAQVAMSLRS